MTLCISSESVTTSSPPLRIRSTRLSLSSRSSAVNSVFSLRFSLTLRSMPSFDDSKNLSESLLLSNCSPPLLTKSSTFALPLSISNAFSAISFLLASAFFIVFSLLESIELSSTFLPSESTPRTIPSVLSSIAKSPVTGLCGAGSSPIVLPSLSNIGLYAVKSVITL